MVTGRVSDENRVRQGRTTHIRVIGEGICLDVGQLLGVLRETKIPLGPLRVCLAA